MKRKSAPELTIDRAISTRRGIVATAGMTFTSRATARVATLMFVLVTARYFTLSEFAAYSYIIVLVTAFAFLSESGAALATARAHLTSNQAVSTPRPNAPPIVLATATIGCTVFIVTACLTGPDGVTISMVVLAAAYLFANKVSDYSMTLLRSTGHFSCEAVIAVTSTLLYIITAGYAVMSGASPTIVIGILAVKEALTLLASKRALGRVASDPTPDLAQKRTVSKNLSADHWSLLRTGIRLSVASMSFALLSRVPMITIGNVADPQTIASYALPARITEVVLTLSATLSFALYPHLTRLYSHDPARARSLLMRVTIGVITITAAGSVGGVLLVDSAFPWLFGEQWSSSVSTARIAIASLPAFALLGLLWYSALALQLEAATVKIALLASAFTAVSVATASRTGGADAAAAFAGAGAAGAAAGIALTIALSLNHRIHESEREPS